MKVLGFRSLAVASVCALALLGAGCTTGDYTFGTVSTRLMDFTKEYEIQHKVLTRGESRTPSYLIVFNPNGYPKVEDAIEQAIGSIPNCVGLANVKVSFGMSGIPCVAVDHWFIVTGSPIVEKTPEPQDAK